MDIFASLLTLRFSDHKMEQLYRNQTQEELIKYNWLNVIFTLVIVVGVNCLLIIYINKEDDARFKIYCVSLIISLVLFTLTVISLIIVLNKPGSYKLQKLIAYQMAITSYITFSFYRYFIYSVFDIDNSIGYFVNTIEYIIRGGYAWFYIMTFIETALCSCLQLVFYIAYWTPLVKWWASTSIYNFAYYFIFLLITDLLIYFFIKEDKKSFALKFQKQKNFEWYESIINKSNTGLMQIRNNRVVLLNNKMMQNMRGNEKLSSFIGDNEAIEVNKSDDNANANDIDVNNNKHNNENEEYEYKRHSTSEVLSIINESLSDFLYLLLVSSNTESSIPIQEDTNIALTLESGEDKELKQISNKFNILELLKKRYFSLQKSSYNKTFINYGTISFEKRSEKDKHHSIQINQGLGDANTNHNNNQAQADNEKETIKLEILYSYYQDEETNKDCFDFIFNDVTQTTKKAEFKYKSLYFSKIAHEFKNPLITILELSDKLQESKDFNETKETISLIKAYSNYMLFLAKDVEAFTNIQLKEHNCLSVSKMSIAEMIIFITQVANGLIGRYNKTAVQFIVNADLKVTNSVIVIDEIKLKQILINIISNAVKFTNKGSITLDISFSDDCKLIKFVIADTGIGMNEMTKKKLLCPFYRTSKCNNLGTGLGMCIINELSKMIKANLEYNSIENIGTKFWLDIPLTLANSEYCSNNNSNSNENKLISTLLTGMKTDDNLTKKHSPISLSSNDHLKRTSLDLNRFTHHRFTLSQISTSNTIKLEVNPLLNENFYEKTSVISIIKSDSDIKSINCINGNDTNNSNSHDNEGCNTNRDNINLNINDNSNDSLQTVTKKKCLHIIVADDEPIIRKSTIRVLQNISKLIHIPIEVYETNDGFEILYLLTTKETKNQRFDLILCDENMVYCNGLKCQKELNYLVTQQKIAQIPFYLLSANYAYTSIKTFHISKPLSNDIAEQLLNTIAAGISLVKNDNCI